MRKGIVCVLLAALSVGVYGNVETGVAAVPNGYYDGVDGKKNADAILNELCSIIDNHTVINYKGLEPYYEQTDFYSDTLWDMYSTCRFTMADANHPQSAVCDGWNKEHLVCQSWLGSGPMVSDLFNVYPTDARINNLRSNYPYGVVGTNNGFSKDPQHHGLGKLGTSKTANVGIVFEPDDQYKGDFARSFFYMAARYRNNILNSGNGSKMYTSNPTNLTAYSLSFLLEWHRNDPVSQKEIDRNQAIYGIQHNRNPFIDYPELAEYIWGNRAGQAIDLSAMTPTCEGGGYTPDEVVKYAISWSVNGAIIQTDSVIANRTVSALPETPVSCSDMSDTFVGWTDQPLSQASQHAPAILYKKASEIPAIAANNTLYAVFANATTGKLVEPAVYVYDEENQNGWTNTATSNGTYWLLDKGKVLTSPEINLAGMSSIKVNMRTYGGTQYCNLDVKAGSAQIATIEATSGKSLTDYTWTNTSVLTGSSPLTFSTNYASGLGIGLASVTINATGSGITYSDYITSCETTGIEKQPTEQEVRKVLINGQLYIMVNEQLYTIMGQRVY